MPDILIRDVPEDVVAAIDRRAKELGLSRNEFLRGVLRRERRRSGTVTVDDLRKMAEALADLDDPEVMRQAWS